MWHGGVCSFIGFGTYLSTKFLHINKAHHSQSRLIPNCQQNGVWSWPKWPTLPPQKKFSCSSVLKLDLVRWTLRIANHLILFSPATWCHLINEWVGIHFQWRREWVRLGVTLVFHVLHYLGLNWRGRKSTSDHRSLSATPHSLESYLRHN